MANLSTKRATAAKQGLLTKGLIKEVALESGKRGAASMFLEVVTNTSAGRLGNGLHNYLRRKAEEWYLAENCKTESEKSLLVNGQSATPETKLKSDDVVSIFPAVGGG